MSIVGFNEPVTPMPCVCVDIPSLKSNCPICRGAQVIPLDERCLRGEHDWLKTTGFDPTGMLDRNGSPMVVMLVGKMKGQEIVGRGGWNECWNCQREHCSAMHFEPPEPPKRSEQDEISR